MKRFRKVYVEITNICNMHCSFCPETSRAKAFMLVQNFKKIAKQIVEYTDYIYLHVKGEPLLHPDLEQILDICNKYDLKINISTNAILLKEKYEIMQKANIRQLNISLHSFENEKDELGLKDYLKNTIEICNKLARNGTIIRYKLWNAGKSNELNILKYLKDAYNIKLPSIPYIKDKKLTENIFLSIKTPFKWPDIKNTEEQKDSKCYGLKNQIAILVDGTVVPCCVDNNGDINLGNIFDSQLKEILECKRAKMIKQGFEDNKCVEKLCKKCEYRKNV